MSAGIDAGRGEGLSCARKREAPLSDRRIIRLDIEDRLRAIEHIPLFSTCDEDDLRSLAESAYLLAFDDGELIVPEGEDGLGFYLIMSGEARVVRHGDIVGMLGTGEFFGEVSLIEGTPRTADVYAVGRTVCLGLVRSDFRSLMVREPRVAMAILEEEGRRLAEARAEHSAGLRD